MSDKIHLFGNEPRGAHFGFICPGCSYSHTFLVGPDGWTWNGSLDKPSFMPSLLVNGNTPQARCHSFVKDGKIAFQSDCWHSLKGQIVDMPDWKS